MLMSMVAGKIIYEDGRYANIDADQVMADVAARVGQFEADIAADPVVESLPITRLTAEGFI